VEIKDLVVEVSFVMGLRSRGRNRCHVNKTLQGWLGQTCQNTIKHVKDLTISTVTTGPRDISRVQVALRTDCQGRIFLIFYLFSLWSYSFSEIMSVRGMYPFSIGLLP